MDGSNVVFVEQPVRTITNRQRNDVHDSALYDDIHIRACGVCYLVPRASFPYPTTTA